MGVKRRKKAMFPALKSAQQNGATVPPRKDGRFPVTSRSFPFEYFMLHSFRREGPVVGHIGARPISDAVIDGFGRRYHFVGVARRDRRGRLDVKSLRQGEWIVAPDLIYSEAS